MHAFRRSSVGAGGEDISLLEDGDVVFVDASEDDEGASKHIVVENRRAVPFISGLHTIVAKGLTDELSKQYRRYCFQTRAIRKQFFYMFSFKLKMVFFEPVPGLGCHWINFWQHIFYFKVLFIY